MSMMKAVVLTPLSITARSTINDKIEEGREIIDIGPDFARRRTGYDASPFYKMERKQLRGYSNYKKVFTRSGKFGGLFNEW